ncbi:Hypothetical protein NocV09_01500570 [Nannochloropsis oceanica]
MTLGLSVLLGLSVPTTTLAAHLRRNDWNASSVLNLANDNTIEDAGLHTSINNAIHDKGPLASQDKTGTLEWAGQAQATPNDTVVSVSNPMGDQGGGLTDQIPGMMPFGTGIVSVPVDKGEAPTADEMP